MLWVNLVEAVMTILTGWTVLLPDATALPFVNDLDAFFLLLGKANDVAPLSEAVAALAVAIGVELAMVPFIVARAVWRFVPFVGGG